MLLVKAEPEWAALHRIADSLAPDLQAAFLRALATLQKQLPLNALTELLESESSAELGQLVANLEIPQQARDLFQQVVSEAAQRAAETTALRLGYSFTLDNPAVARWAGQYAGQQIVGITQETKLAVRSIVEQSFQIGRAPRDQARLIRQIVGLTERDAGAVARFQTGLEEASAPRRVIERQVTRMRDRLLRRRTENIARTETIRASNQGQLIAWRDAADQNLITPSLTRRVWIATDDDRTCPLCMTLDGQTVGFEGSFDVTGAAAASGRSAFPDHDGMTPPAHVACRCATGLEFDEV